jgi:glutaredoxin-like protein NrdH
MGRRIVTAREQVEMLSPWRTAVAPLESINPTGGLFVDYDPQSRTGPHGPGITTLDKVHGSHPDEPVTIYRGAPHHQNQINPGDFITTDPTLAQMYGPRLLQMQVPKSHVATDPDEWEGGEHIYSPRTAGLGWKKHAPVTRSVSPRTLAKTSRATPSQALPDLAQWPIESIASFQKDASMVTLYTKPNCPACVGTKRHLDKHEIPHRVVDVTQDSDAYDHITGMGYTSVPVVVAGDDHWSGFRPDRIKALKG